MSSSTDEIIASKLPELNNKPQVYKIRWFILGIFVFFSASNAMQWIQYAIIGSVIREYYGISSTWVNWTSIIYMVLYIPFIFPASYLLEKLGLRKSVTIGMFGTCLGALIKLGSINPDRFYLGFIGQSVVALSQVFVLSLPSRLAAIWFGPDQVSSACSIGVFGNQVGVAAGFIIPPMIVTGGKIEEITAQLYILFIGVAVFTVILLILILIFFKDAPPTPPSYAAQHHHQLSSEEEKNMDFMLSLKRLFQNRSYIFLLLSYGINVGIFYAISTLLSDIILRYYTGAEKDAGRIGLVITISGMVGSVCCGYVLDRFRKFKETTIVVYAFSLIGMLIFTFTLDKGISVVYLISAFLGFFMTGLLPVGFELGSELTYPEPEGTQAGLLNAASQVFGIAFTNLYSELFHNVSDIWANLSMCIGLAVGLFLISSVSSEMRRQSALKLVAK